MVYATYVSKVECVWVPSAYRVWPRVWWPRSTDPFFLYLKCIFLEIQHSPARAAYLSQFHLLILIPTWTTAPELELHLERLGLLVGRAAADRHLPREVEKLRAGAKSGGLPPQPTVPPHEHPESH